MTERDRVTVSDPRGPVNNGEGHQYVFYGGADWMIRKGVESLRIAREDRLRLADRSDAGPYFWDTSHSPHRPAAPRAQDEDEDGS